ncbi:MAG: hypothetical protein EOP02_10370 [Proteobacteria bacterium]|nr:MAG: hypothetical protein EOP02_10370 [Pseudomonadota bacterium]
MTESHTPAPKAIEALPRYSLQKTGDMQRSPDGVWVLLHEVSAALAAAQAEQAKPDAEQVRAEFERYASTRNLSLTRHPADRTNYHSPHTMSAWDAVKAVHAAQPSPPSDRGPAGTSEREAPLAVAVVEFIEAYRARYKNTARGGFNKRAPLYAEACRLNASLVETGVPDNDGKVRTYVPVPAGTPLPVKPDDREAAHQVTVDRRDVFDAIRNAWVDGATRDEGFNEAEARSLAHDYSVWVNNTWLPAVAPPQADRADAERLEEVGLQFRSRNDAGHWSPWEPVAVDSRYLLAMIKADPNYGEVRPIYAARATQEPKP